MHEYVIKKVVPVKYMFNYWYRLTLAYYTTSQVVGRIMVHQDFLESLSHEQHIIDNLKKNLLDTEINIRSQNDHKKAIIEELKAERKKKIDEIVVMNKAQFRKAKQHIQNQFEENKKKRFTELDKKITDLKKHYDQLKSKIDDALKYLDLIGRRIRISIGGY